MDATIPERERRDAILLRVLDFIRRDERIKLPPFVPDESSAAVDFAFQSFSDNDFSAAVGPYRYQLEGEDDLLHLAVVRSDGSSLTAEEGRWVAEFVFPGIPPAVIWLRPGQFSQHFYVGHDELLSSP